MMDVDGIFRRLASLSDISVLVASISWVSIAALVGGAIFALAADAGPRLRYLYLHRGIRPSYGRPAEEDEPKPLEASRVLSAMARGALVFGAPLLLLDLDLEELYFLVILVGLGWLFLVRLWRWQNDPDGSVRLLPEIEVPREALLGALAAAGIVLFMLAIFIWGVIG